MESIESSDGQPIAFAPEHLAFGPRANRIGGLTIDQIHHINHPTLHGSDHTGTINSNINIVYPSANANYVGGGSGNVINYHGNRYHNTIFNHNFNHNHNYNQNHNHNSNENYIVYNSRIQARWRKSQSPVSRALEERYVPRAAYDAQPTSGCTDGTRVQILSIIRDWIMDPSASPIFWLTGSPGSGKTAIAWTVCSQADEDDAIVLGGSFFCSRKTGIVAQGDVRYIVPTLAQLLALQSAEFSDALAENLARDPDITRKRVEVQVHQLLCAPLLALREPLLPLLFVIDALDQCNAPSGISGVADGAEHHDTITALLLAFSHADPKLPIRVLITSRTQEEFHEVTADIAEYSPALNLDTIEKQQITSDIHLHIADTLLCSPRLSARFTEADIDVITHLSDSSFLVAATAIRHILGEGLDVAVVKFQRLLEAARNPLITKSAVPLDHMLSLIERSS